MEAVGGFPAHLKAPLTAGLVSVRHPLLYRFPFKLGEHDTDIQHGPPHRGGGIKLLCRGNKLHIVLLEQFHHVGKVQNGTADTVKFVNNDLCFFFISDILHIAYKITYPFRTAVVVSVPPARPGKYAPRAAGYYVIRFPASLVPLCPASCLYRWPLPLLPASCFLPAGR